MNKYIHPQQSKSSSCTNDNMKVMIRVRPPLQREIEPGIPFRSIADVKENQKSISLVEYLGAETDELERQREFVEVPSLFQLHRFTFDSVFDETSTQEYVYTKAAWPSVTSVLEGYNSTIFAYGQTGTGKTHTMEGYTYNSEDPQRGIIPRCIEDIFNNIESSSNSNTKFIIRASYWQLYNENISDWLKPEKQNWNIREDKKKGIYVDNLSEWVVRNPNDIYALLEQGAHYRATSSTFMNDVSSRSHAIFIITVEQMLSWSDDSTKTKIGKLNLVDLAGSERIRITGPKGKQLEESKKINKSLSALGNVINALTEQKVPNHIPYRDSKLTRLLADSLGGNCKTTMITMISPCHDYFSESLSSWLFSKRAKNIRNRPVINEDLNHRALISQYEIELKNLRKELEEKNRMFQSNELLIELEEQKKQAEHDKKEAIKALEQASQKIWKEREEKKKLEMKISLMNSQMIMGGHKIEETPQFRSALEERQNILLQEFDNKLQEFEKEREQLEEDQVEVERYKELLLKQRDIMISLTTKLNERDETIVQLQEELDAFDRLHQKQEKVIKVNTNKVNRLKLICKENSVSLPSDIDSKEDVCDGITPETLTRKNNESKIYWTYEEEKEHNRQFDNLPLTMLTADEKIKELKGIIKEQENEINILKLVSQKFIWASCESEDGKVDINDIVQSMGSSFELHSRIREYEEEKSLIWIDFEKQNEIWNSLKLENESINEQCWWWERKLDKKDLEVNELKERNQNGSGMWNEVLNVYNDEINPKLRHEWNAILNAFTEKTGNWKFHNSNSWLSFSDKAALGYKGKQSAVNKMSHSSTTVTRSNGGNYANNNIMHLGNLGNPYNGSFNNSNNNNNNNVSNYNNQQNNWSYVSGNEKSHTDEFISKFINAGK